MTTRAVVGLVTMAVVAGLWLPATSAASEAQAGKSAEALLARGAGYDMRHGSARVRTVQRRLDSASERPGPVDGLFGPLTQAAVIDFQRRHGLVADGIVGPRTHAALRRAARLLAAGAGYGTRHGSARVLRLQRRLRSAGAHPGPADGRFGPLTERAVIRFQRQHGLVADGLVGPATMGALTRHTVAAAEPKVSKRRNVRHPRAPRILKPLHPLTVPAAQTRSSGPPIWIVGLLLLIALALGVASLVARRSRREIVSRGEIVTEDPPDPGVLGFVIDRGPEGGASSEAQIAAIKEECGRRGLELVGVVRTAKPSVHDWKRDALPLALDLIAEGHATGLVIAEQPSSPADAEIRKRCMSSHTRLIYAKAPVETPDPKMRIEARSRQARSRTRRERR